MNGISTEIGFLWQVVLAMETMSRMFSVYTWASPIPYQEGSHLNFSKKL